MTADNSERIAEIQEVLQAGATSVTVDGTSVNYDFAELRKELRTLMESDAAYRGRRPVISSIDLSNAF